MLAVGFLQFLCHFCLVLPNLRTVDEDSNILKVLGQLAHKGAHLIGLADVELQRVDLDAITDLLGDLSSNLLDGVDAAGGEDDAQVLGAGVGELKGARLADARRGAGDEDGLAGEALAGSGGDGGRHGSRGRRL